VAYVCLIKSLERLLETTTQCYAAIWSTCIQHGSALT